MFFGILGEVEVRRDDGTPVALGGPKVRALLTLLLADAPHVVTTDRLIDGVYGDEPPEGAANALQSQVSRLRRSLDADVVERTPLGYRLAIDPQDIDSNRFATLLDAGRPGEALALWRGTLPPELGEAQISRLAELRLRALEEDIEASLGLSSVPRLRELITEYPLRERFRGQLMRALAAGGRQAEALTVFEDARRTLADELGADPSTELADTHVAILRSEPVATNPVPAQLTSFVGRDADLERVAALLTQHRLVTLTGPGGTGKTRLAVEVTKAEPDVCLAEFANTTDVPQAVLDAFGLRAQARATQPPAPPADRLVAALADRHLLLVFDNCEHVIDAAARLAGQLLARLPLLRILATSREPLGITGEALYPVPRLPDSPAERLFLDRATAVRGAEAFDPDQVRHICAALDGLPLAIELAAARARSLSLDDIAARLDDRFGLLSKGSRTADARHRTLRAVVEWSWDLLDETEQALAARLTVFAGGALMADVEQVTGRPADLLTELVDKSLVEVVGGRYRMLETIRAFCAEKLGDATEPTRRAHAEHFLAFASEATANLLGADQLQWLDRTEAEHDNLHSALRWAVTADSTLALRLVGAMSTYWWMRGRRLEGAQLCLDLALRLGPQAPDGQAEEYALCLVNAISAEGHEPLRAHLKTLRDWGENRTAPPSYPFVTIVVAPTVGPPTDGRAPAIIGSDPWSRALEPLGRSFQEVFAGDVMTGQQSLTDALARFEALGERWGAMQSLTELAVIVSWKGEHDRAIAMLDRAMRLVRELGSTEELCEMTVRRADCRFRAGDTAGARGDYERAEALANRLATPGLLVGAHVGLATIARRAGDLAEARRLCRLALEECGSGGFGPDWARWQVQVALGWLACAEGNLEEATDWLKQALNGSVRLGNNVQRAAATAAMANVALLEGDPTQAARLLGTATRLRGLAIAGDADVAAVSAEATRLIGPAAFGAAYRAGLSD
ncbi:BTAD domain-containing putative transcriptional regulator [Actinocrispum wychmicini]|uniref:Putative ATPase n=1 Tax=Actinocrispum wychmicini TaxID=1213861 RepID=A0A4R2IRE3_9PSEU|nr:BTAD domain-containing putative transcriptional regulator [Actinocrispum wychmicini]TCO46608.1 putative ATPase [Actinocrispum wychmicini]